MSVQESKHKFNIHYTIHVSDISDKVEEIDKVTQKLRAATEERFPGYDVYVRITTLFPTGVQIENGDKVDTRLQDAMKGGFKQGEIINIVGDRSKQANTLDCLFILSNCL